MDIFVKVCFFLSYYLCVSNGRPKAVNEDSDFLNHHKPLDIGDDSVLSLRPAGVKVSDLQPPDHLEAVRLEQDGHLNRDYLQEVFIGHHHEQLDEDDPEAVNDKLTDIFHKVDTDSDSYITEDELCDWIKEKVKEHFQDAATHNGNTFNLLDTDHDGFITWTEFHFQFLVAQGHDIKKATIQAQDYEAIPLESQDKELLIRHKFKWAEADNNPADSRLSREEFVAFQHPEQSPIMITKMARDILDTLDENNDNELTVEEFASLPMDDSIEEDWQTSNEEWKQDRRKEFTDTIDLNKDGKVTEDELLNYVDPQNPAHAQIEASELIESADDNEDGKLSLKEVLENAEVFLGSKVVDTGRNFHDEF